MDILLKEPTGSQPTTVPEGVQSLEFIKRQVDAGIKPQVNHFWGQEFADKKFAMMLEGSWLLGTFPREQWAGLNQSVGMIPMFPVPNEGNKSATMMGGWILSIPETSQNKELSWELLTLIGGSRNPYSYARERRLLTYAEAHCRRTLFSKP